MKKVTLLFGLAGLSLCTAGPLGMAVVQAQDGIPLVCRPPEPGESPNAYIKTSGVQGRTVNAPLGATPPASPATSPATSLPASPRLATVQQAPLAQSPASGQGMTPAAAPNSQASQPMNQFSREVQTGSSYRLCPPPTMPSENPSTQLYAVPFAVAAAWDCYGPREMAYTPRLWRGPDPAVHSPLPIKPTRAAPASRKAKPATSAVTPEAAGSPGAASNAGVSASPAGGVPNTPAVGQLPVPNTGAPALSGAGALPPQNGVNGTNGGTPYRPTAMGGQGSVAAPLIATPNTVAPLIATSAPTAPPLAESSTNSNAISRNGQPYGGAAAPVSPSRDIVDTGDNIPRVAQAPMSLLDAPPLTPNPTPAPSGFSPR